MGKKIKKNQKGVKTIVMTGGHAGAAAYATMQEIRKRYPGWNISWIGAGNAMEGSKVPTLESISFPKMNIDFFSLITGRLQRRFSVWTIPSLLKIPIGFIHASLILRKIKPHIVVSFGGYTSFPVVFISYIMRIPVVLHEQTVVAGRANQKASRFAKKIAISRENSKKYFPDTKTILVGNPVSSEIRSIRPKKSKQNPPLIFITGGSRGSVALNNAVNVILKDLLDSYRVIHQVGVMELPKFEEINRRLDKEQQMRYEVIGLVPQWEWYKYIEKADIVVSRSGANIVSELLITKRPSLLIPLPFAYLNEQLLNAKYAKEFGIAQILPQDKLAPSRLYKEIKKLDKDWNKIVADVFNKPSIDFSAATKLVDLIAEVASE